MSLRDSITGQISAFIIIGMLVIIAFSITLYVGGKMRDQIESKPTQQRLEQLGIQPLQDYVTTCLTLAASEGLTLVGRQGGLIYKKQGGNTPDFLEGEGAIYAKYTDADYGLLDVPFLILPPKGKVGEPPYLFSEPPDYPFQTFPFAGGEMLFKGYYGRSNLSPLYRITPTGEQVAGSIQETLEQFIAKKTVDCADWNSFEEKNYHIVEGPAVATLIFANKTEHFAEEQNINAELSWPLEVTTPGGDKTVLTNFAIRLPVRLATIYFTVKKILDSDVTDISYVPDSEGAFIVTKSSFDSHSFLIVKDQQSTVANKPFEFWIARKNRIPALWMIDVEPLKNVEFHVTPEGRGARVEIEGNQLQIKDPCPEPPLPPIYAIPLNASDPDEDQVTYSVHIPGSSTNEIPSDAKNFPEFSITVFAKDKSTDEPDSQEIPLKVVQCPVQ